MKPKFTRMVPIIKVSGGANITIFPQQTYPLEGYVDHYNDEYFDKLESISKDWFEKFPYCCEKHKKLGDSTGFNKEDFRFVEKMIVDNVKFFTYALEKFLSAEDWYEEISQYYEYLHASFGSPGIGDHIFIFAIADIISKREFDKRSFSQEERTKLLYLVALMKSIEDQGEMEVLYNTFTKWVNYIPAIGELEKIKKELAGIPPVDLFFSEIRHNKYLGISKRSIKKTEVFIKELEILTVDLLQSIKEQIKNHQSSDMILVLSEERLRIRQEALLDRSLKSSEMGYINLFKEWVEIWIDYFKDVTQIMLQKENKKFLDEILFNLDLLRVQSYDLEKLKKRILKLDKKSMDSIKIVSKAIERDVDNGSYDETALIVIWDNLHEEMNRSPVLNKIVEPIDKTEISIKKKIKFSIPLFLFIKYEGELEIGNKSILPKNLKELKRLFLKLK